jgi:hypothetical protein
MIVIAACILTNIRGDATLFYGMFL